MKTPEPHVSTAWITLASFHDPAAARELTDFLREEGIDARVQDERRLQKNWFLVGRTKAGVHVRLPEPSFNYAQNCLEMNPAVAERCLRKAVRCPSCGSPRVHFPQMTRKNVLPTLVAQALVLVGLMKLEYFCEACNYTWRPPTPRRSSVRKGHAPDKMKPHSA
jgi:rubredoxin